MRNHFNDSSSKTAATAPHALIYAPEFGPRGLSNHVPMAKYALKHLGATAAELTAFEQNHCLSLDKNPPTPITQITEDNFSELLGKRQNYLGYYHYFIGRLQADRNLPNIETLYSGIGAAAFHALIRLAYGIEAHDQSEIAAGLAYWADAYQNPVMPSPSPRKSNLTFSQFHKNALNKHVTGCIDMPTLGGTIFEEIACVAGVPAIQEILQECMTIDNLSIEDIARCNLDVFLRSNNFTALHLVTSAHAIRFLLPLVSNTETLLKNYAAASIATMFTIPADIIGTTTLETAPTASIKTLQDQAKRSGDDHTMKFTYTCISEYKHYGADIYIKAAAMWIEQENLG